MHKASSLPQIANGSCPDVTGYPYLDAWANSSVIVCAPKPADAITSTITCYPNPTLPGKQTVCTGEYLVMNSVEFMGENEGFHMHRAKVLPRPVKGAVKASCDFQDKPEVRDALAAPVANEWFVQGLMLTQARNELESACTGSNYVDHPVFFLTSSESTNFWHHSEDIVTTMATFYILREWLKGADKLEIVFADFDVPGYFMEIWQRLAAPVPIRHLPSQPYPPGTCFRKLIQAGYGLASAPKDIAEARRCPSLLYSATALWLADLFPEMTQKRSMVKDKRVGKVVLDISEEIVGNKQEQHRTKYAGQQRLKSASGVVTKTVLWLSRRNYERVWVHHPGGNWGSRVVDNEDEVIQGISSAVLRWNAKNCIRLFHWSEKASENEKQQCRNSTVFYRFAALECGDLPFYPDQIYHSTSASILVGVHGAHITHQFFQPLGLDSGVVEVAHNFYRTHFICLANWLGHRYTKVKSAGPSINVQTLVNAVTHMMDDIAQSSARYSDAEPSSDL